MFKVFFQEFRGFVGPQGPQRGPNGSLLGAQKRPISAQFETLVASWFQSGSQTPKRSRFGSLLGCILDVF